MATYTSSRPPQARPNDEVSFKWVAGGVVAFVLVIWLLGFIISWVGARATPQAGQIGVERTGSSFWWAPSWFNGHGIRGVVPPGSGSTYIGLGSTIHYYPADSVQRNYTISANPAQGDTPGVDVVHVPTGDGINVGLQGTFFFTTAFNAGPGGEKLVRDFDNRFGIRQFSVAGTSGPQLYPWQGNEGWESFVKTVKRPNIDKDQIKTISGVTCAQLVSSCALVHQQSVSAVKNAGGTNSVVIQRIQDEINSSLDSDIASTLGRDYFSHVRFLLSKVALPGPVQQEIEKAQAQFAAIGTSQARVQQAKLDAQANAERQKGYHNCPACAAIDELKSIPSNVTTFAPGNNFAITSK